MSNGQQCCLVGVCCPAESSAQRDGWAKMIMHERPHLTELEAYAAADRVLKAHNFFHDVVGLIDHPV